MPTRPVAAPEPAVIHGAFCWSTEPAPPDDTTGPAAAVALASCRERLLDEAALAAALLRGEEIERCGRFRVEHARRDFLAGRLAAKTALGKLAHTSDPLLWEIRRGRLHEPVVLGPATAVAVTLAHADGLGLAIAHPATQQWGIDFEPRQREGMDIVATQVSPGEAAWARAVPPGAEQTLRWLLLWTAREALGKALRTGLSDEVALGTSRHWKQVEARIWEAGCSAQPGLLVRSLETPQHVVSLVAAVETLRSGAGLALASWLNSRLTAPMLCS